MIKIAGCKMHERRVTIVGSARLVQNRPIYLRPVAFFPVTSYIEFDRSTINLSVRLAAISGTIFNVPSITIYEINRDVFVKVVYEILYSECACS